MQDGLNVQIQTGLKVRPYTQSAIVSAEQSDDSEVRVCRRWEIGLSSPADGVLSTTLRQSPGPHESGGLPDYSADRVSRALGCLPVAQSTVTDGVASLRGSGQRSK